MKGTKENMKSRAVKNRITSQAIMTQREEAEH